MRGLALRTLSFPESDDNDMSTLATVQDMLVAEFELTPDQVAPASKLADLGIDSLATLEFLFKLEEAFSLDLNSDPTPVETVGDIAHEVDRMLALKGAAAP